MGWMPCIVFSGSKKLASAEEVEEPAWYCGDIVTLVRRAATGELIQCKTEGRPILEKKHEALLAAKEAIKSRKPWPISRV